MTRCVANNLGIKRCLVCLDEDIDPEHTILADRHDVIYELKSRGNINCVVISSGAAYLFYLKIIKSNEISLLGLKTHWVNRIIQNPRRQLKRVVSSLLHLPKIIASIK